MKSILYPLAMAALTALPALAQDASPACVAQVTGVRAAPR